MRRSGFSQAWVKRTQTLAVALVGAVVSAARATEAEPKDLLPAWEPSCTLKVGAGYKDNVAFAHTRAESSAFIRTAAEAIALRLPIDGNQFTFLVTGEDTRYLSSERVKHEDIALAQG